MRDFLNHKNFTKLRWSKTNSKKTCLHYKTIHNNVELAFRKLNRLHNVKKSAFIIYDHCNNILYSHYYLNGARFDVTNNKEFRKYVKLLAFE